MTNTQPNPFLDMLPTMLTKQELFEQIKSLPELPDDIESMSDTERREKIYDLESIFLPLDYMYYLYDIAYRSMRSTYRTINIVDATRQLNAIHPNALPTTPKTSYITQALCSAVLGVPGIGKTSTLRRVLHTLPQVIEHHSYGDQPFFCRQITHLFVECPSDCSVKTLAFNIAYAVDNVLGSSNYAELINGARYRSASAAVVLIKQTCLNHHIGLIVLDEIQNAVRTANDNKQSGNLIRFLVELMNDTCTAVLLVGTPETETLFTREEHLKRRTRGPRLLPMDFGETFRGFLEVLWTYSFVRKSSPLTENIRKRMYELSGGIPAYLVRLYQEAQIQAIMSGSEKVGMKEINAAAKMMAFKIPTFYAEGIAISQFEITQDGETEISRASAPPKSNRGRKQKMRDQKDILALSQDVAEKDLVQVLKDAGLMHEVTLC